MPDPIEPTPEAAPAPKETRDNEELTTASLAKAGEGTPDRTRSFADAPTGDPGRLEPLFAGEESERLRTEWTEVQASFVDEPRAAVEQADRLVATAIKRLAEMFAEEKGRLEGQWDRGGDISTEDLRQALRRYRSFFDRVLSV